MHRFDARSKFFIVFVYSVCLFFYHSWWAMGLALLFLVFVIAAARLSPIQILKLGSVAYFLAAITVMCNTLSFVDGGMRLSVEGLLNGVLYGLRIVLLVWMSLVLCLTTTLEQINGAIASILSPLRLLRIPVDDIAMTFSIAIRFLPQTAGEFMAIKDAQWSRGGRFSDGGLFQRIQAHLSILLPLIINLFRRSEALATSMDARCYGLSSQRRGCLCVKKLSAFEGFITAALCLFLISIAIFI